MKNLSPHKQNILRACMEALLAGKDAPIVEYQHSHGEWDAMTLANTGLPASDWTMPDERYRLKPATTTINGKEYAAPLTEWPEGADGVWSWGIGISVPTYNSRLFLDEFDIGWKQGYFFATKEQATAVHDALISILTNGEYDAQK